MKFYYLLVFLFGIMFGCKSMPPFLEKKPDPPPKEIAIKGVTDGIDFVNKASRNADVLRFRDVDDEYEIKKGDNVVLALDYNLTDADDLYIMSRFNPFTNTITIGLYDDIWDQNIMLNSKCDVIEIRGLMEIPKIILDPTLENKPEQIVITPIFDDSCHRLGFQIRYGSTERGCGSVAKSVLRRFNKCVGGKKTPRRKRPCWEKIWFGVPCP